MPNFHLPKASTIIHLVLSITLLALSHKAYAAPLSLDGIRADAVQYATWTARFTACGGFFHEEEGLLLQQYDELFMEGVRQDLGRQLGNASLDLDDETLKSNPDVNRYMDALTDLLKADKEAEMKKQTVTPAACTAMIRAFTAYYEPFEERITRPAREKRLAEVRAYAPTKKLIDAFTLALGEGEDLRSDEDQDNPEPLRKPNRGSSDLAAVHKLWAEHQELHEIIAKSQPTIFREAAAYTDPQGLQFLLTNVCSMPAQDCSIKEAFESALTADRYDNAAWLVDHADKRDVTELSLKLLFMAQFDPSMHASSGKDYDVLALPVLERLFAAGLSANASGEKGNLLSISLENKEPKISAALIAHGANINGTLEDGTYGKRPWLTAAVQNGNVDLVRLFLKAPGIRLDDTDGEGRTALEAAISNDQLEMVQVLLDAGAKLRAESPREMPSPLLASAKSAAMVQLLIKRGANPRWLDADGNILLAYMYYDNHLSEIIPVLVAAGMPLNQKNKYGSTILNYADKDDGFKALDEQRSLLISLGAQAGKPDHRVTFWYQEGVQPVVNKRYRIRLANGRVITGRTDIFGKASWTPDGQKYHAEGVDDPL